MTHVKVHVGGMTLWNPFDRPLEPFAKPPFVRLPSRRGPFTCHSGHSFCSVTAFRLHPGPFKTHVLGMNPLNPLLEGQGPLNEPQIGRLLCKEIFFCHSRKDVPPPDRAGEMSFPFVMTHVKVHVGGMTL
jgi:hypothetical protein